MKTDTEILGLKLYFPDPDLSETKKRTKNKYDIKLPKIISHYINIKPDFDETEIIKKIDEIWLILSKKIENKSILKFFVPINTKENIYMIGTGTKVSLSGHKKWIRGDQPILGIIIFRPSTMFSTLSLDIISIMHNLKINWITNLCIHYLNDDNYDYRVKKKKAIDDGFFLINKNDTEVEVGVSDYNKFRKFLLRNLKFFDSGKEKAILTIVASYILFYNNEIVNNNTKLMFKYGIDNPFDYTNIFRFFPSAVIRNISFLVIKTGRDWPADFSDPNYSIVLTNNDSMFVRNRRKTLTLKGSNKKLILKDLTKSETYKISNGLSLIKKLSEIEQNLRWFKSDDLLSKNFFECLYGISLKKSSNIHFEESINKLLLNLIGKNQNRWNEKEYRELCNHLQIRRNDINFGVTNIFFRNVLVELYFGVGRLPSFISINENLNNITLKKKKIRNCINIINNVLNEVSGDNK